jgi:lia operon protein LiaG
MKKIFVIFLILIGLYWIFTNFIHTDWLPFGSQEQEIQVTDKIQKIKIDVSSLSTVIIPEERDNLKAELTGQGKVRVEDNGDEITVSVKRKWFDFFSFDRDKVTIYIPKDYKQAMEINLGSGSLNFSSDSPNKPMKLEQLVLDIGSGNVELSNMEIGELKQDVSSGNVKINSVTTKSGTFDISSGNLELRRYSGGINADLSSGRFFVQMDRLVDDVKIEVSSGKVDLNLPKDADFTLNGEVSSGNISCDFPLTTEGGNNKSIKGTYGSGKHKIDLSVSSGNIRIY